MKTALSKLVVRARIYGRTMRGDPLTDDGKRVALLLGAIATTLTALAAAAAGAQTLYIVFSWASMVFVAALVGNWWINFVPKPYNCDNPEHYIRQSPSGDVQMAYCVGCQTWRLAVRDTEVAAGEGIEALAKTCRDQASMYQQTSSEVAAELIGVAEWYEDPEHDALEAPPDITPLDQRPEDLPDISELFRDLLNSGLPVPGEGKDKYLLVAIEPDELDDFHQWREQKQKQETADVG